ncbi:MAG: hypothetical protein U1D30_04355 [Planctomycetota bacterium]
MLVPQIGLEGINLLDRDFLSLQNLLEQRARRGQHPATKKDEIVTNDRRRNDDGRLLDIVFPKQLAIARRTPIDPLPVDWT